jgi:hypothetical protein
MYLYFTAEKLRDVMPRIYINLLKVENILERKVALSVALVVRSLHSEQNISSYGDSHVSPSVSPSVST